MWTSTTEGCKVWRWNTTLFYLLHGKGKRNKVFQYSSTLPLCHENPDSKRREAESGIFCYKLSKWVFLTLKIQESREKQGYKDFQHLDPLSSHPSWMEQGATDPRVRVWSLHGSVFMSELDSGILGGPLQLRKFCEIFDREGKAWTGSTMHLTFQAFPVLDVYSGLCRVSLCCVFFLQFPQFSMNNNQLRSRWVTCQEMVGGEKPQGCS